MYSPVFLFGVILYCSAQGLLADPSSDNDVEQTTYELHVLKNRMILVQRDEEEDSIKHCQLFGTRVILDELMNSMEDLVLYDYEKEASLNAADFKELLTDCEEVEYSEIEEFRKHVQTEKKLPKHIMMEKPHMKDMQRQRRSIGSTAFNILQGIYPGTKWCGLGNIADGDELGQLAGVDACCRQHDKCPTSINLLSSDSDTGLFNFALYTKSHCDCDVIFKDCLKDVKNEDANNVGNIFFDILNLECYKLDHPEKCVERAWWLFSCNKYEKDTSAPKEWYFTDELTY